MRTTKALARALAVLFAVAAFALSAPVLADTYVNGYFRSDGTYVAPHYRTAPNDTRLDNFTTKGNVNPYTGQPGYKNPYNFDVPKVQPYQYQPRTYQPYTYQPYTYQPYTYQPAPTYQPYTYNPYKP
jgi:hypothetical protein